MKKIIKFHIWTMLLFILFLGSASSLVAQEKKQLKGYAIVQVDIRNQKDFFEKYGSAAFPPIVENGGVILAATYNKDVKEGKWDSNWTVVLEFPSIEAANAWYNSDQYQNVAIPLRKASTGYTNMVFVQEFSGLPKLDQ